VGLKTVGKSRENGKVTIFNGKIHYFYGKSPFLIGNSTVSMAIFNSYFGITRGYVKEREGNNRLRSISTHPPFAGVQV
jgi:hypothetical protein